MYNRRPSIQIERMDGRFCETYQEIVDEVRHALEQRGCRTLIVDCYPGVRYEEIMQGLIKPLNPAQIIFSDSLTLPRRQIDAMIQPNLTQDRVFGVMSYAKLEDYFDADRLGAAREQVKMSRSGLTVIYGVGASLAATAC